MSNDQFDKKLAERLHQVFDDYEVDSADSGWQELRKKLPLKNKNRPAIWWFGSVAAVLVLAGIWLIASRPDFAQPEDTKISKKIEVDDEAIDLSLIKKDTTSNAKKASAKSASALLKNGRHIPYFKEGSSKTLPPENEISNNKSDQIETEGGETDLAMMALTHNPKDTAEATLSANTSNSFVSSDTVQLASNTTKRNALPPQITPSEQFKNLVESGKKAEKVKPTKQLTLNFLAGRYINYAQGSESSFNTSIGIASDIKILKKLRLTTGVSLGQNSLKYNQYIPQYAALSFSKASPKLDALAVNQPNSSSYSTDYSINSYQATLLGFDIPVNLTYTLIEKRNTFYLSTGFSSNFFINESYVYNYQSNGASNNSKTADRKSTNSAENFDFARVLNFSMGFDHPLTKKTRLALEPFLKYPLSGLGAHDLRFGAAGINLKLNFSK